MRAEIERLRAARDAAVAANQARAAFLATMSHEIREPMNSVLGMARLLRDTPLDQEQRGYVDSVIAPSQTRTQIVRALRTLRTKRETLPPKKHGNIPL
jgi:signal transduction histidine kinase